MTKRWMDYSKAIACMHICIKCRYNIVYKYSLRIKRILGMASRKIIETNNVTEHHDEPHFHEVRSAFLISLYKFMDPQLMSSHLVPCSYKEIRNAEQTSRNVVSMFFLLAIPKSL